MTNVYIGIAIFISITDAIIVLFMKKNTKKMFNK